MTKVSESHLIEHKFLFAPEAALFAILLANPCQILWDFMCAYLEKIPIDKDNPKRSCYLLAYQCFISFLFVTILLISLHYAIQVAVTGDSFLVFVTFALTWIIEQFKQFGTLSVVYLVVVKRFGYLKVNEKEFVNEGDKKIKMENAIPRLQNCCLRTLQHNYIENLSLLTISLYTIFILFDLTISQFFDIEQSTMNTIDFVFLNVFFAEIALKTFASSGTFLMDGFNLFDAAIVIGSWALMIKGITFKGLGVLRLIRVVVITIRSITGKKSSLRHMQKQSSPVEQVIEILKRMQNLAITNSVKKEAKFVAQIIEDNKLY